MSLVRRNGPVKERVSALGADRGEEQNISRKGCSAARCSEYIIAQLQN